MRRRSVAVLLALALALAAAAGCGGDDDGAGTTATDETTTTTDGTTAEGRATFVSTCGSCHTLSAAGTSGTIGPSLDGAGLSVEQVEAQVRQGGGGMPAFQDVLTEDEIAGVSAYVADASGG